MLCSIDGASQETYQKYRVGGNYELTMKNIKLLNTIRKKKNLKTPVLLWRFLVFRHNQHEIEIARKKAKELGVQITFLKPYVDSKHPEWISTIPEFSTLDDIQPKKEETNSQLSKTISVTNPQNKINEISNTINVETSNNTTNQLKPCTWLWSSIVINANGSVSPCCAIENQQNDFGFVDDNIETIRNNQNYQSARGIFSTLNKGNTPNNGNTVCHNCPVPHIQQEMRHYDEQIITYLLENSSSPEKSKIISHLKSSDKDLYLKSLEICKRMGHNPL